MSDNTVDLDEKWVQRAFLLTNKDYTSLNQRNTMWSDAVLKYTDTTLGGNIAINPPPQFTRYCDVPVPGRTKYSSGMGRYYSEAIDDNSQVVHFRMGLPRFNTLASLYLGAYNPDAALAGKSSRVNKLFFELGKAVGFVISVMSFKLLMVRALGSGLRLLFAAPSSKYYYLSPAMPMYWSAVTTIVNQLTVNRGIVPRVGGDDQKFFSDDYQFTKADLKTMHDKLPDVFREDGGIDVYAVANRAKRMFRKRNTDLDKLIDASASGKFDLGQVVANFEKQNAVATDKGADYLKYMDKWYDTDVSNPGSNGLYNVTQGADAANIGSTITGNSATTTDNTSSNKEIKDVETTESWWSSAWKKLEDFFQAEADDGGMFASFRVNYTGSVGESFSNSAGQSSVESKLNDMVSSARNVNFSLAGGNISDGVGKVVDAAKGLLTGAMNSLGIGGLAALGGSAFFDIPKVWESSTASLPRSSYTIKLASPYGNPISQMFSIYIPLAMLLAMALPISAGKQSYGSPFLIEYYDKGRAQSRLGMVDSLSITRGTSSLGFNNAGHALAIDVTLSIMDLSSIMHMPISMGISPVSQLINAAEGGFAGAIVGGPLGAGIGATVATALGSGWFDDSTVYSDYLAILAGMGVNDQIYASRKLKLALTRNLMEWKSWFSISHLASFSGDMLVPGRLASIFYKGVQF